MKRLYGYSEDSIAEMLWAIDVAYELVEEAPNVDKGLLMARDILHCLLQDSRLS